MARSLKTRGMEELIALRRRTNRQYSLGRITQKDCQFIISLLEQIEARIIHMMELNETGEEEGDG